MPGTPSGIAKARAVSSAHRAERLRAFIDAWNAANSVAEVAAAFGVKPQTARSRAYLARKRGMDVKHMTVAKGRRPALRVGHKVCLEGVYGSVIKRMASPNEALIEWSDGRLELVSKRGRTSDGKWVEPIRQ